MATAETAAQSERPESVGEWCDHHGLIGALLPFGYRRTETFDQFRTLAAEVKVLPKYQATFKLSDLLDDDDITRPFASSTVVTTQLKHLGAWPYRQTSSGMRWINPNYVHDHPWETAQCSTDKRTDILREAASYGVLTVSDVAPRFGLTTESLRRFLTRQEFDWSRYRCEGIRRLARTLATVHAWRDWSERELAAPFRRKTPTVRSWIHTYARTADWTPPADPSYRSDFQQGESRQ
ncbi:hypothetical protein [Halobellus rubicundus]|uniref:Helix-turn-helix domain-containing protein n=1 Tax=Halobellus rubicundus TaxID=2996466 RepID=A0ABD5MJA0_9EURY